MNEELVEFSLSLLRYMGALVEPEPDGSFQVMVPPDVAASIGVNELFTVSFEPEKSDKDLLIAYGTPAIDSIRSILEKEGRFIAVSLPDLYVKSKNLDKEIIRVFEFPRGRVLYQDSHIAELSFLLFNFHYSAVSDERFEGVISVAVNESTLAIPEGMAEKLSMELSYALPAERPEVPGPFTPTQCYRKVCRHLEKIVGRELSDFKKSMRHRLLRDRKRLHEYYEGILKELDRKKKKTSQMTEESKAAQREAVKLEFNAKGQELLEKYSIRVMPRLFSVCRVIVPSSLSRMEIRTGGRTTTLSFCWNALTKGFEPLVCSQCHGDTYEILMSRGSGVLCRSCAGE